MRAFLQRGGSLAGACSSPWEAKRRRVAGSRLLRHQDEVVAQAVRLGELHLFFRFAAEPDALSGCGKVPRHSTVSPSSPDFCQVTPPSPE